MLVALVNCRAILNGNIVDDRAVFVEDGKIKAIAHRNEAGTDIARHDLQGRYLLPGFIDTQVNGGGGVLFGERPTLEALEEISATHAKFGTTGLMPTLISSDYSVIRVALKAVEDAIAKGVPGILGIHIEGPFLNPIRRGIHDAAKFRTLDNEALALLTSLKRGKVMVTLAPEQNRPELISALSSSGVIVSAGHSDASYSQMNEALRHGVRGFTHLFNAMSPLLAREPGMVGAALEDDESYCGIIVDGKHVSSASLRIALRCKRADRIMLVTDAMPSVGTTSKSFTLQGRQIAVKDGVCVAPDGTLAGSDLDMASALRNTVRLLGIDLATASRMASGVPADFLGLSDSIGSIAPGKQANLISLDKELNVHDVWMDGHKL